MATAGPSPEDEKDLDAVLADIDRLVDKRCEKATKRVENNPSPPSPTKAFSPEKLKKTRMMFQQLSEEDATKLVESTSSQKAVPEDPPKKQSKRVWPFKRAATG